METPFFGSVSTIESTNLADDSVMNLYQEVTPEGKRRGGFVSTPGLAAVYFPANNGAGGDQLGGADRGIAASPDGRTLVMSSGQYVSFCTNPVQFYSGYQAQTQWNKSTVCIQFTNKLEGPVGIQCSASQIFAVDGFSGYCGKYAHGVGSVVENVQNATVCAQQDGFVLCNQSGTNKIAQSNLNDWSTFDPLNISYADSDSSPIVGMASLFRQLWLLKSHSTEIWQNVGANGFSFSRVQAAFLQVGCAAGQSVATSSNGIYWLGTLPNGRAAVFVSNGYNGVQISTPAINYAIAQQSNVSAARGFVYEQYGHTFYVLNFLESDLTVVYDESTRQWHLRGEYTSEGYGAHDAVNAAFVNGNVWCGSWSNRPASGILAPNGVMYLYDKDHSLDDVSWVYAKQGVLDGIPNPKRWYRRWRALAHPVSYPVRFPPLQIDMQTGLDV